MKKMLLLLFVVLLSSKTFAQDFEHKKDNRPQWQKEDAFNQYRSQEINNLDLIRALDFAGINMFKFTLKPFDKKYGIKIQVEEYKDGTKINTKTLFKGDNTYIHFTDPVPTETTIPYTDYIDQLLFFAKDDVDASTLRLSTYAMNSLHKLEKKKEREHQGYNWRSYSKADWKLDQYVPLLVYASTWFDKKYNVERFCGVVDLSLNEEDTKELLNNSTHYYVISYKISAK